MIGNSTSRHSNEYEDIVYLWFFLGQKITMETYVIDTTDNLFNKQYPMCKYVLLMFWHYVESALVHLSGSLQIAFSPFPTRMSN